MKNKLSLCVITGNAERYVERFLDSFGPLADEIVMIRATGSREHDRTLEIAKDRGCRTGVYYNQGHPSHDGIGKWSYAAWPHVDDFAAARNRAFACASHDLIMWADMDDVIDAESIKAVRDAIDKLPDDFAGLVMDYHVPEDGLTVSRERIIRKGSATWESPIHEFLRFHEKEPKIGEVKGGRILHAATGPRGENDERNIRILESIPEEEKTPSHRFHTFQSLRAVGRIDEAREYLSGLIVNRKHEFEATERYELYIALAQMTPDPELRAQLVLQAVATDPTRREAFGEMVLCSLGMGCQQHALAWAEAMNGLSAPAERSWNSRSKYYGYAGIGLHAMALRANGRREEADAIQTNHFIRNGAKISLLHATRGRGKQAVECRQKWLEMAKNPDAIEHIFAMDADDDFALPMSIYRSVILRGDGGPVAAWNTAARDCKGEILVQLSDDWDPPRYWDQMILDAFPDTSKPGVLWISDGHRTDQLLCMAILTRARYKDQGNLMFHPDFFSMYSDNWFSYSAFRDNVVIDVRDKIQFEHLHPMFGRAESDETYERSNTPDNYRDGEGTYNRLVAGTFLPRDVPGWCDYTAFYKGLAKALPEGGTFVEIGSWFGQSIITLCQALQDLGKTCRVICVDTFQGEQNQPEHQEMVEKHGGSIRKAFESNIEKAKVADMIEIIEGDSAESAALFEDGLFDGIYIDAAHDYDSVTKDLAAWFPKLKPGGIWAGHDYPWHEVEKAVKEHAAANGYKIGQIGRVWIKNDKEEEKS